MKEEGKSRFLTGKRKEEFVRRFLDLFVFIVLALILSLPFSYAVEATTLSPQNGLDVESLDAVQETVEETDLPIYVEIDRDMKKITLINQNDVPVDLYILALDAEGFEIASWPLPAFSDPVGLKLKLADIFGSVPEDQIASVKVVSDDPIRVIEIGQNESHNLEFKTQQSVSSQGNMYAQLLLSANPLPVLFKPQVPPGTWSGTNNCGQTSSLMAMSYRNGASPTEQGIKNIDDWLYNKYGDPINNYNGSVTNTTKLAALVKEYGGFAISYNASGWNLDNIRSRINEGLPVIAAVTAGYLSNRGYTYSGGHFVVVIGYTDTYIICNDPGTTSGEKKYYSNTEFSQAFAASGGSVVVVIPNGSTCADFGEPNGSFSSAYALSCGTTSTAKICSSSDVDYYKVTPTSSGTMTIRMTPPSDKDYDLYVYNSSQTPVCSATLGMGLQDVCSNVSVTGGQTYYIKVIGYGGASSPTANYSLGVTCPSATTDVALQSGVPSNGSVSSGQWKYYYIDVPSGASKLEIKITNLTNDVDLYTQYNAKPTLSSYTCRPYLGSTNGETCTYTNPSSGRWWAGVYGYSSGSYTITATVTTGTTGTPTLLIDGGTSSTKAQGSTFTLTGSNYTPNGTITRYVNGTSIGTITASNTGTINSWTWPTNCSTAIGTYTVYAKDDTTGKTSNTITEVVTSNSSCSSSDVALQSGAASNGSVSSGQWKYYYIDVPSGASKLEIKITNLTSDVDLYTQYNAKPALTSYSCRPYLSGANSEVCTYTSPSAGRWWAGVYGYSSGSYSITATITTASASPTLLVDGSSSSTRAQLSTFTLTGSNYTPNGTISRYVNGTAISSITASSSGTIAWSWPTNCTTATGTYTVYTKDDATAKTSNSITEIVTASSSCSTPYAPSSLYQYKTDGSTSISYGGTTNQSTVVLKGLVSDPGGRTVKIQIELRRLDEYSGSFTGAATQESGLISSGSTASIAVYGLINGNYHWRARTVNSSGVASNWVSAGGNSDSSSDFIVSVPPTLLINGGTSSTKSQGGTFVTTGYNYTPGGAVTRYLKQPNGTTITLSPTLYANSSGNISWSYTSICTTATGTYYIWVKDNATGRYSNTVTEIITHSSSCP